MTDLLGLRVRALKGCHFSFNRITCSSDNSKGIQSIHSLRLKPSSLSLMFIFRETCFSIHFIAVNYSTELSAINCFSSSSFVNFTVSQSIFPSSEVSILVNEGTKQQFISAKCFAFYSRNELMK